MSWNDVFASTALEQAALIRTKSISSEELVRAYLDRIDLLEPKLNAFVGTYRSRALAQARQKDAAVKRRDDLPQLGFQVSQGRFDLRKGFAHIVESRFKFGHQAAEQELGPFLHQTEAIVGLNRRHRSALLRQRWRQCQCECQRCHDQFHRPNMGLSQAVFKSSQDQY